MTHTAEPSRKEARCPIPKGRPAGATTPRPAAADRADGFLGRIRDGVVERLDRATAEVLREADAMAAKAKTKGAR